MTAGPWRRLAARTCSHEDQAERDHAAAANGVVMVLDCRVITMHRLSFRAFVVMLGLLGSACGNERTAVSPSPPVASVTSVSVAGPDAVKTNSSAEYTATAMLSDGTTRPLSLAQAVTWSSSEPGNATVSFNGRGGVLSGRTHGPTVISVTSEGRTGSKPVSIVNDYGGGWTGSYAVTFCDASGAFASSDWCRGLVGTPVFFSVELTQFGNDLSQVSGTFPLLLLRNVPVTGHVTSDGRLVLGADMTGSSNGLTFRFQVGGWETRLAPPPPPHVTLNMTGRMAFSLSGFGGSGNAYEEVAITYALRTHPQPTVTGRELVPHDSRPYR